VAGVVVAGVAPGTFELGLLVVGIAVMFLTSKFIYLLTKWLKAGRMH